MTKSQPDPDWQPISRSQLEELISAEVRDFDAVKLDIWNRLRVPLAVASIHRSPEWGEEQVFLVARRGDEVLFYDDVEDEFAVGRISGENVVSLGGLAGELHHAIAIFSRRDV
jgi:hypothetical protein